MLYTRATDDEIGLIQLILGRFGGGHGLRLRMMIDATKPRVSHIASTTSGNALWPTHPVSLAPRSIPLNLPAEMVRCSQRR